jgi:hypothetical protein
LSAGWTFGAELEWPDVDVRSKLPDGWAWSRTDYTVVGSDGVANDPLRKLVFRSGELNTPVCDSVEELAERVAEVRRQLKPGHNYRSNLHVHVAAPEFADVAEVRKLADFSWRMLPGTLKMSDPLNGLFSGLTDEDEIAGAKKRAEHSERSRHFFISDARHERRMSEPTVAGMVEAGVPRRKLDGKPAWALAPREAVNLLSLRKHGTVEFRCFAGDSEDVHVWAAASFCRDWVSAALNEVEVFELPYFFDLPPQAPFQLKLERGWEWTNFKKNKREVVRERLEAMGKL